MRYKQYFLSFRRALFTQGIMGRPAARLVAEFRDHLALKQAHFVEAGNDATSAEEKACVALGEPQVVAVRAAETLQQGCWMARRPICFGLAFGVTALLINLTTTIAVACICEMLLTSLNINFKLIGAEVAVLVVNWLPALLGFAILGWISQRRPAGWRSLVWGACFLILSTSFFGMWIASRSTGPEFKNQVCLFFEPFWGIFLTRDWISYLSRLLLTLAVLPIFRYGPALVANLSRRTARA